MKLSTPHLLTFNGGYVDTAGFLALQGLFTAHVTGNFVTLGASLIHGTSGGTLAKLLALPLFCLVVALVRSVETRAASSAPAMLNGFLLAKIVLLAVGATLAIRFGPFEDADGLPALATGLTLVAAMAIQNALHRIHFPKAPPTTLMTGSTTQVMIDVSDLLSGSLCAEARQATVARCASLAASIVVFAVGCGCAALLYAHAGTWVFALPPVIALLAFLPHFQRGHAVA